MFGGGLIKNKKGMFFTLMTIALISLFILVYTTYSFVEDRRALDDRISTMNNFFSSLQLDLSRQLYISGFRTIFLMEKQISDKGLFINNVSLTFNEAFFNGTFNGLPEELMSGATFEDIKQSMIERADKINVDVNFYPAYLKMVQEDAWKVKVILGGQLIIRDKGGLAFWNKTDEFYAYIEINNFNDPLYTIGTYGKLTKKINSTIFSTFVFGNDVSNLSLQLQRGYFIASNLAPSFLDRLEGKNLPNPYGIESFVYLPDLTMQGILAEDKSVVDWIYFSNSNPLSYHIRDMPGWFRVDFDHLNTYGVSGLTY